MDPIIYHNWHYLNFSEPEPFEISELPPNLLKNVVSKMSYRDFSIFDSCSRFSTNICQFRDSPLELSVHRISFTRYRPDTANVATISFSADQQEPLEICENRNVKIYASEISIIGIQSNEQMDELMTSFDHFKITGKLLKYNFNRLYDGPIVPIFTVERFAQVLEKSRAQSLSCINGIFDDYLKSDAVKNLNSLCLHFGLSSTSLLELTAAKIQVLRMKISPKVLNAFLKQWESNSRDYLRFKTYSDFVLYDCEETIFEGLPVVCFDPSDPDYDTFPFFMGNCLHLFSQISTPVKVYAIPRQCLIPLYIISCGKMIDVYGGNPDFHTELESLLRKLAAACGFCGDMGDNCLRMFDFQPTFMEFPMY